MIKFIDVTGKTEDEAIQSALAQLKMDRDDVSVEILERAKARIHRHRQRARARSREL